MGNTKSSDLESIPFKILRQMAESSPNSKNIIKLTDQNQDALLIYLLVAIKEEKLYINLCITFSDNSLLIVPLTEKVSQSKNYLILRLIDKDILSQRASLELRITENSESSKYQLTGWLNCINKYFSHFICSDIEIEKFEGRFVLVSKAVL